MWVSHTWPGLTFLIRSHVLACTASCVQPRHKNSNITTLPWLYKYILGRQANWGIKSKAQGGKKTQLTYDKKVYQERSPKWDTNFGVGVIVFNSLVLPDGVRSQNEFIRTRRAIHPALQMEMYSRERETGWFRPWCELIETNKLAAKEAHETGFTFQAVEPRTRTIHIFSPPMLLHIYLFLKKKKITYVIQRLGRHFVPQSCYISKRAYKVKQHFKHEVLKCPLQQPTVYTFQTNKKKPKHSSAACPRPLELHFNLENNKSISQSNTSKKKKSHAWNVFFLDASML